MVKARREKTKRLPRQGQAAKDFANLPPPEAPDLEKTVRANTLHPSFSTRDLMILLAGGGYCHIAYDIVESFVTRKRIGSIVDVFGAMGTTYDRIYTEAQEQRPAGELLVELLALWRGIVCSNRRGFAQPPRYCRFGIVEAGHTVLEHCTILG
jgi:hypothetical protein